MIFRGRGSELLRITLPRHVLFATFICFVAIGVGLILHSVVAAILMGGAGGSLWYLQFHRQHRARFNAGQVDVLPELPQFLEIVTLAVYAGLSFQMALQLYIGCSPGSLSVELKRALEKSRIGLCSTEEALMRMAQDLSSTELETIIQMSFESLRYGVPLANVLQRQIDLLRAQLQARTQERLERAPVWMLIPTATLILPAMLLAVIGPLIASAFATS